MDLPRQRIVEPAGDWSVRTQRDPVRTPAPMREHPPAQKGGVAGEHHPRIDIGSGGGSSLGLGAIAEPASKHEDQQQCSNPRPAMSSNHREQ